MVRVWLNLRWRQGRRRRTRARRRGRRFPRRRRRRGRTGRRIWRNKNRVTGPTLAIRPPVLVRVVPRVDVLHVLRRHLEMVVPESAYRMAPHRAGAHRVPGRVDKDVRPPVPVEVGHEHVPRRGEGVEPARPSRGAREGLLCPGPVLLGEASVCRGPRAPRGASAPTCDPRADCDPVLLGETAVCRAPRRVLVRRVGVPRSRDAARSVRVALRPRLAIPGRVFQSPLLVTARTTVGPCKLVASSSFGVRILAAKVISSHPCAAVAAVVAAG